MLTEEQIEFLNKVCPNRWTEENDIINVVGSVNIRKMILTQIPVQFGHAMGNFYCSYNNLLSLQGSPSKIDCEFTCRNNQLTSLVGGPKEVGNFYSCRDNKLTNLIGAPKIHNHDFLCESNQLTSLEGCPSIIKYHLNCSDNPNLKYLWGIGHVKGKVHYDNRNEINEWIIECARKDIIFPHLTLEENINWIKQEQKYSILLGAPKEIHKYFSPRILQLVDSGVYNESRILDYKKFSNLC